MFLHLMRYSTTKQSTLGVLYVDGWFECYSLEDTKRLKKVAGETRIPDGIYPLRPRIGTPMEKRYRNKYAWHRSGMIEIENVENFDRVYFHPGNSKDDTEGCILLGDEALSNVPTAGLIRSSVTAYKRLYRRIDFTNWNLLRISNIA